MFEDRNKSLDVQKIVIGSPVSKRPPKRNTQTRILLPADDLDLEESYAIRSFSNSQPLPTTSSEFT